MHGSARRIALLLAFAAVVLLGGPGCSRKYFREKADCDVAGVITQKNRFPDWQVKNWHVYPDPRSRFADPFNPDRPPYPPDDYAARVLSPNPQRPHKKNGVGRQDGEGYLRLLEQWDAENRAGDGAARGAPPERVILPRPVPPAPDVGPDRPTVRKEPDISPWVSSKPRIANVEPAMAGPRVTEHRGPVVVVAGEVEQGGKIEPAVATVPVPPPGFLPDKLPAPMNLGPIPPPPEPPPANLKALPALPEQKTDAPAAPVPATKVGTGEPAAEYLRALATNQTGYRVKIDQAVELGLVNSREFQDRREDLYLAALPVTLERFNFAAQAFFTEEVIRRSTGRELAGAGELWQIDTTTGFSKRFPTGAALLVRLANQVVIDLSGKQPTVAFSNFALSVAQPFLRGGGFAVNLEPLTQVERNMVYAIRSYARFRKLFYVATVGGTQGGGGLTNNPYGLQGLSVNLGRGIGGNLTAPVVGFLPLLQQAAVIANQQRNVAALEQLLQLYRAFREGGQQSDLQVGQVEVNLLSSRAQLLGQGGGGQGGGGGIRGYLDALDNFKLQLGLPLTVALDLDNTPLKPVRAQLARFEDIYADVRQLEEAARRISPADPVDQVRGKWRALFTDSSLVKGTAFAKSIGGRLDEWGKLTRDQIATREAEIRLERTALLEARAKRLGAGQPEQEADARRLAALESDLELMAFELALRNYEARPWLKIEGPARGAAQAGALRDAFNSFYLIALAARNERVIATRGEWPKLPALMVNGVDLLAVTLDDAHTAGIQAALSSRLDLMNARGQVVDSWRQIAVQANSLQGSFDVRYDLSASTPASGDKPFAFSGDRTQHQLTLRGDLPLVRRAERNNYRAALIGYQRQRRTLMAFEDNIANDVRNDIRELRTLAEQYKIQQRVVELGYSQVDNAQAILLAPPAPGVGSDAGSAAALTDQVLRNQQSLVQAQNTLYTIWVSYQTARMNLYLDLELMQLDDRGVWNDEQIPGTDNRPRPVPERVPGERLPAPQPAGAGVRK